MIVNWAHAGPSIAATFLASLVEFVEALTVVLAVGTVRGWRGALAGSGGALGVLLLIVIVLGPALARIPLHQIHSPWESFCSCSACDGYVRRFCAQRASFRCTTKRRPTQRKPPRCGRVRRTGRGWDAVAIATAFKITMLEELRWSFIVIAVGAGGIGLLIPASAGAVAALIVVVILGVLIHKPLSMVPENTLKFAVGVLLTAFGTFWVGEGMGLEWPAQDWSISG